MTVLKLIIWLLVLLVIVFFSVQNLQTIELKYYNFNFEQKSVMTPLIVVLLGSIFGGFLLASFFGIFNNMRLKNVIRRQNQTIKSLDQKVAQISLNATQPTEEKN